MSTKKYIKTCRKGTSSDCLVPLKTTSKDAEITLLSQDKKTTKCQIERDKQRTQRIDITVDDLRSLLRCAQIVQIGLNNRLNAARGIGGNVEIVGGLEKRHSLVMNIIKHVNDDVEKQHGISITPNSFI